MEPYTTNRKYYEDISQLFQEEEQQNQNLKYDIDQQKNLNMQMVAQIDEYDMSIDELSKRKEELRK
jgi:hypothetical protein